MNDRIIFGSMEELDGRLLDMIWGKDSPFATFVDIATALLALFSLIVVANMAYKMMTQDGKVDVMRFTRMVLLSCVLAYWPILTSSLYGIVNPIEKHFMAKYDTAARDINDLRRKRMDLAMCVDSLRKDEQVMAKFSEMSAEERSNEQIENEENEQSPQKGYGEIAIEFFEKIYDVTGLDMLANVSLIGHTFTQGIKEKLIFWIGETYWEICVYYIFLIKNVFLIVLVIGGPIYVICSMLDIWKNEWANWISRMVTVSFYGTIAYMIMGFVMYMIHFALETDISMLEKVAKDRLALFSVIKYEAGLLGSSMVYIITLFIGGKALLMVPNIASWIIPSDSIRVANDFMEGMLGSTVLFASKGLRAEMKDAYKKNADKDEQDKALQKIKVNAQASDTQDNGGGMSDTLAHTDKIQSSEKNDGVNNMDTLDNGKYGDIMRQLEVLERDNDIYDAILNAEKARKAELLDLHDRAISDGMSEKDATRLTMEKTMDDLENLDRGLMVYKEALRMNQEEAFFLIHPSLARRHMELLLSYEKEMKRDLEMMKDRYKSCGGHLDELNEPRHHKFTEEEKLEIRLAMLGALRQEIEAYEKACEAGNKVRFLKNKGYDKKDIMNIYGKYDTLRKKMSFDYGNKSWDTSTELEHDVYDDPETGKPKKKRKTTTGDSPEGEQMIRAYRVSLRLARTRRKLEEYEIAMSDGKVEEFMTKNEYDKDISSRLMKELEDLERQWKEINDKL